MSASSKKSTLALSVLAGLFYGWAFAVTLVGTSCGAIGCLFGAPIGLALGLGVSDPQPAPERILGLLFLSAIFWAVPQVLLGPYTHFPLRLAAWFISLGVFSILLIALVSKAHSKKQSAP